MTVAVITKTRRKKEGRKKLMTAYSIIIEFRRLPAKEKKRYLELAKQRSPEMANPILLEVAASNIWVQECEQGGGL